MVTMRQDLKAAIYEAEAILKRTLQLTAEDKNIIPANKKHIVALIDEAQSRGLTTQRLVIILQHIRRLARLTETDFAAFTSEDAKHVMTLLEKSQYSDWTKITCKKIFKQLMRQFKIKDEVYNWITCSRPPNKLKKEDLLTPDEIRQLITSAPNNMWKALISMLAESGCRPGEALNLTIGDIMVNSDHIKVYVAGKMARSSGERPLFLFKTYDLMKAWLQEHPARNNPDAPLWVTKSTRKPLTLCVLNIFFHRISKRAGITKRCYPYLLRHCKGTEVYIKYAPALAMKMMGHGDITTGLVYTHLAESDVLEALQQENGIKPKKSETGDTELCLKCGHQNPYGSIQCNNCKAGLGAAGAIKVEKENEEEAKMVQELKGLLADPQIIDVLKALKKQEVIDVINSARKIVSE